MYTPLCTPCDRVGPAAQLGTFIAEDFRQATGGPLNGLMLEHPASPSDMENLWSETIYFPVNISKFFFALFPTFKPLAMPQSRNVQQYYCCTLQYHACYSCCSSNIMITHLDYYLPKQLMTKLPGTFSSAPKSSVLGRWAAHLCSTVLSS